jgi:hypothetical protein
MLVLRGNQGELDLLTFLLDSDQHYLLRLGNCQEVLQSNMEKIYHLM